MGLCCVCCEGAAPRWDPAASVWHLRARFAAPGGNPCRSGSALKVKHHSHPPTCSTPLLHPHRSGCFVAGKDAGRAYNTWPDMNGEWFPSEYFSERLPGEEHQGWATCTRACGLGPGKARASCLPAGLPHVPSVLMTTGPSGLALSC